ncbi:MAG: hypothetical protein U1E05_06230, partial [Patescibacteria group bacterium]|nr:hypothetical protein [Patescibacteria group bacterium]
ACHRPSFQGGRHLGGPLHNRRNYAKIPDGIGRLLEDLNASIILGSRSRGTVPLACSGANTLFRFQVQTVLELESRLQPEREEAAGRRDYEPKMQLETEEPENSSRRQPANAYHPGAA